MKSKIISAFLVVFCLATFAVFAGGASEAEQPGTSDTQVSSGATGEIAEYARVEGKKYTFTIAPYNVGPIDEDGAIIKYFEEMYDVDFDIWYVERSSYSELMGIKFASGEIPDMMNNSSLFTTWVEQGILAAIPEEVLKTYAPNMFKVNSAVEPNFLKPGMIDGKIYAITAVPRAAHLRYSPMLWRGDWLDTLGITKVPDTLDEFEAAFTKITRNDPDGNGSDDTYGLSASGFGSIYGAFGLSTKNWFKDESNDNNDLVYGAVAPKMKEALAILANWYSLGIIDPEFITGENTGGYWAISHAFFNGRIGFTSHAGWSGWYPPIDGQAGGAVYNELYKLNPNVAETLVQGTPPEGPYGDRGTYVGGQSKRVVSNVNTVFGKHMETEKDRLGTLLFIMDDINCRDYELALTRFYGFKGEDWDFDENGKVVRAEGRDNTYLQAMGAINVFQMSGASVAFDEMQLQGQIKWAEDNGYTVGNAKHELFVGLPSQGKYLTELNKIRDEAFVSIITGDKPIDYFDEFVNEWYKAGGQVLTEEASAWYKDFWGL